MDPGLFIQGMIVGLTLAVPVGPISLVCIHRTVAGGRLHGIFSGLGVATSDSFYAAVAFLGMVTPAQAAEEKLLGDARTAYASGAPPPLPEERGQPQRYAERIARLRQSVQLHERNIEALRKELAAQR